MRRATPVSKQPPKSNIPGEREREELRQLIREAHEAAQELKRETKDAVETWQNMHEELVETLTQHVASNTKNALHAFETLVAEYMEKAGKSMEDFYKKVFGDTTLPPSVYTAMMMCCTAALADALGRQSTAIAKLIEEHAYMRAVETGVAKVRITYSAAEISALVTAHMAVLDQPLITRELADQLFGTAVDYTRVDQAHDELLTLMTTSSNAFMQRRTEQLGRHKP